eukprot:TRINITY_DN349_c0_g1_i1.p2 TRINITY_DN349_c0_g1~~TRINITY_DN349_c0_g1_i1.p2  ORF type:complete len:697 (-),score=333.44 TRINITY_DN349_c0_g1_i1:140-2230(-)
MAKVAAALSLVAAATAAETNPLSTVIGLCKDLEAKVVADGEAAEKAYKEYFEWCDDVATEKTHEIETATSQKEKLEAKIAELSAEIETADSKIADLASSISTADADLKDATELRKKEAADFATSEKELAEVVDTLSRAVGIIEKEMQKGSAAFAQLANSANMQNVLQSLSVIVDAASFSVSDKQRLVALVQSQQNSEEDEEATGAPAAATYKNQSGGILDVLADMQEKAETQLSELRKAEVTAKNNYSMLKQGLDDQLANENKDMDAQKSGKAAAEEGKATAEGDLSVTIADLKTSTETLEQSRSQCMTVASDHEASIASRAEEVKVINEALKILEATTSGAEAQTYSLLQTRISSQSELARSEIVVAVKKLAKKHHSSALAQLASRIAAVESFGRSSGGDPFVKIRGLIQDMISKLENEAAEEATEKAYCDEELSKTKAKKEELEADVSKLTTNIDQAAARSAELKQEVADLQSELAALAKEQAEMDKVRQDEHSTYTKVKADLELGLGGVRKALDVLRDYYAKDDASLLQQGSIMEQPAPPVSHSASGGAAGGIINILEVCESDIASNLAKVETEEADEAEAYEKQTQENKITKSEKDQDVKYKTQEFKGLDKNIAELSGDRDTANTELAAVNEYDAKLKDRCIAKPETYEERKKRRDAEIEGLKQALSTLENEAALVQRGSKRHGNMRGSLTA